ncbi:MAG: hypothetical protein H6834_09000 [Planctomycetes bacterium]|nr:hypothetical protein [Planctomycetota bacterium]
MTRRRSRTSFVPEFLGFTLALTNPVHAQEPYRFLLDDEEIHPPILSLEGTPKTPRPGDFAWIDEWLVELGEPGTLRLRDEPPYLVQLDPERLPIGVDSINLIDLSARSLAALRTVRVTSWTDEIQQRIEQLGPRLAALQVNERALKDLSLNPSWSLPVTLRALDVTIESEEFTAWGPLETLRGLQVLSVAYPFEGEPALVIDVSVLDGTDLRVLSTYGIVPASLDPVRTWKSLRDLTLDLESGLPANVPVPSLANLAVLERLRRLCLPRLGIEDVTALAHLPALVSLDVEGNAVTRLPRGGFESLRFLDVQCNPMDEDSLAAFRAAHPRCRTRYRYRQETLREAVRTCDRLRVRTGGICHTNPDRERTLLESTSREEIASLVRHLTFVEDEDWFVCGCCGDPTLEFLRDSEILVAASFHHGRSLRCTGLHWEGDAALIPESARFLIDWLAERGVRGPREEVELERRRAQAWEERMQRQLAPFPESMRERWEDPDAFREALAREVPDLGRRVDLVLAMYGDDHASWYFLDEVDQVAGKVLASFPKDTLAERVERAIHGSNQPLCRGAIRLWDRYDRPLAEWTPTSPKTLHRAVVTFLEREREPERRARALVWLRRHRSSFDETERARHVRHALLDDSEYLVQRALLVVGEFLLHTLVPEVLAIFHDASRNDVTQEHAAIALGYLEHSDLPALLADHEITPGIAAALALVGQPEAVTLDLVSPRSDLPDATRRALVDGVVRNRGRHALEWVFRWPGDEAYAFERLRTMLLEQNAPGRDLLERAEGMADLRRWYRAHGDAYVTGLRRRK